MKKTLGGDRLGSGKKMEIEMHGFERSTHDLGYIFRSSMSSGTLVPFMSRVVKPGDTFDIKLDCDIKTLPTIGPLFGGYKAQLDVFLAPIRNYVAQLHNNKLGIGMNMAAIKLPIIRLGAIPDGPEPLEDKDNSQVNPSSLLAYLGIRGVGHVTGIVEVSRDFNAIPLIAYWDIYKNYYSNKQEEQGAVIHDDQIDLTQNLASDIVIWESDGVTFTILVQDPATSIGELKQGSYFEINVTGLTGWDHILIQDISGNWYSIKELSSSIVETIPGVQYTGLYNWGKFGDMTVINWRYLLPNEIVPSDIKVTMFDLNNIDDMRERILSQVLNPAPFNVSAENYPPYSLLLGKTGSGATSRYNRLSNQEGLALKTYQSDLYNNWLSTEWIDGVGGINEITAVDTSGGSFNIDTLILARKVFDMLNRIAVSGGTYDDWLDVQYDHPRQMRAETPMYMGGLIKELIFQEVVNNSEAEGQPLGTLAGKGVMGQKHKGGNVTVKVDEPGYIIGIISLTPRIDYSQGNQWDTRLTSIDDIHKPALDQIGFQESINEDRAWWDTFWNGTAWITRSAGKLPAWTNYTTDVNKTYGNFAIRTKEMFMTLNRRFEISDDPTDGIADLTTYIDPTKFNTIFAETNIDSQNFWVQVGIDITARRKQSAKVMPNL